MRALTIASGILFIATGAFCFINPGQTFMTMAFVVGTVMVIWGIIHILSYLIGRGVHNRVDNNGWIFIDALLTLLLGILILFNQLTVDMAVPMVLGMWVMVSGLLRLEAASRIDREKKRTNFKSALFTGVLTTLIGFLGFVNPLFSFVSIIILVGIFMMIQGINSLELGINMPHEKKAYVKIYKRKRKAVLIADSEGESVNVQESVNNGL
ncbi:MAG: HdeD family acid-resistance protein [Lentihominibacter sp.]